MLRVVVQRLQESSGATLVFLTDSNGQLLEQAGCEATLEALHLQLSDRELHELSQRRQHRARMQDGRLISLHLIEGAWLLVVLYEASVAGVVALKLKDAVGELEGLLQSTSPPNDRGSGGAPPATAAPPLTAAGLRELFG